MNHTFNTIFNQMGEQARRAAASFGRQPTPANPNTQIKAKEEIQQLQEELDPQQPRTQWERLLDDE